MTKAALRAEFVRRLPFETEILICDGRDIIRLMSQDPLAAERLRPDMVRFVTVLAKAPRLAPSLPIVMPSSGKWLLKIVAREKRFVFGIYRRHMKVIGYLGSLDRIFGVRATTRNWNTLRAIAKVLAS